MFKLDKIKIKDPAVWDVLNTMENSQGAEAAEALLEQRRTALRSQGKKVTDFIYIDTTVWVSVHAPQFFKGI